MVLEENQKRYLVQTGLIGDWPWNIDLEWNALMKKSFWNVECPHLIGRDQYIILWITKK